MGNINEFLKSVTTLWTGWSRAQRVSLMLAAVLVAGGLLWWAGVLTPGGGLVPLFSRLDPRDAAAITAALEEREVAYGLDNSGRTVLVPRDQVDSLRLFFAGQGLPSGGVVGFEIMDEAAWATTEFGRKVSYTRALQGELARTINHIDGVRDARVHIVLPESTLFVRADSKATAGVMLNLEPLYTPLPSQTRSIMHLVAASVEGLTPEQVTVIDDLGRVLSAEAGVAGDRLDQAASEHQLEETLRVRAQSLLDQVLGPGNSVIRVRADLDFDHRYLERQSFTPEQDGQGIPRSSYQTSEIYSGSGVVPGVAGVDSNVPGYQAGEDGEGFYQRTETTTNYELAEVRETHQVAPGDVRRLSVAVVVNGDLAAGQQQALAEMISATVGLDPGRGDQVVVMGQPFNTDFMDRWVEHLQAEQLAQLAREAQIRDILLYGGIPLAALLLIGGSVAMVVGRRRGRARKQQAQVEAVRAAEAAAADKGGNGAPFTMPLSLDQVPNDETLRRGLEQLARQDPKRVANALKVWLAEG